MKTPFRTWARSHGSFHLPIALAAGIAILISSFSSFPFFSAAVAAAEAPPSGDLGRECESAWQEDLRRLRAEAGNEALDSEFLDREWARLVAAFPVPSDWVLQDAGPEFLRNFLGSDARDLLARMVARAVPELGAGATPFRIALEEATRDDGDAVRALLSLYARTCEARRALRLQVLLAKAPRIVFLEHGNLGGSHYAYTEGQSDAQDERHFHPGARLRTLEMTGTRGVARTLLDSREGCIRDPDVDFDADRILFSWKTSDREDDFHLHEMDLRTGSIERITQGLGFADYEGVYTPGGDIVFNSTRPVQTVDCWWTEVSNLYTCARDGRRLRRLCFDQVHDNFPTILPDGRVLYTRWEYNDRGQIPVQGLFVMRPDGSQQTALYGNNSWFPTSLLHARGIPGTTKLVAILSGHHTTQAGKLARIDASRGTEENSGVEALAPRRIPPVERVDCYGQEGDLFQYPYPLTPECFLVGMSPEGKPREPLRFGVYLVHEDGRRELLVDDPEISATQPIPLAPRARPPVLPAAGPSREASGSFFLQDIHAGPGLTGIPRGRIRTLRVVALEYRAAGVRTNFSLGPGGDSQASTPISIGNGSWDVKRILGEATVHADGSAWFEVPARTPVYFQALDEKGFAIQTMRSWATLGPGERFSCVGCHEPKSTTPRTQSRGRAMAMALGSGPEKLRPYPDPTRGFSFPKDIQPILDRHCSSCHKRRGVGPPATPGASREAPADLREDAAEVREAFSLLGEATPEEISGRAWSDAYLALTAPRPLSLYGYPPALTGSPDGPLVRWVEAQSPPPMLAPGSTGAIQSPLLGLLEAGHRGVRLSPEEMKLLAAWIDLAVPYCGDYEEACVWTTEERAKYDRFEEKRRGMEAAERRNREAWISERSGS